MDAKKPKQSRQGRAGMSVSLAPLTADQAVRGMFKISKADVKKILASRPGKGKTK